MHERAFLFAPLDASKPRMTSVTNKPETSLADDLLWGCEAIAAEINRPPHITFRLLQRGLIPADKLGAIWTTTRSRLRAYFNHTSDAAA
jgi:hypothetical protein